LSTVRLDCGAQVIDSVRAGTEAVPFRQRKHYLYLTLPPAGPNPVQEVVIHYHGSPRYGLHFFPEQVYTVYATSQWMVCRDHPSDKASLQLDLVLPKHLRVVANGQLVDSLPLAGDKMLYQWREDTPIPTYTFGFAAGRFRELTRQYHAADGRQVRLRYLAPTFSDAELERIFGVTGDMLAFFEEKAGMPYPGSQYTQVLAAGTVAQEMCGFAVIRESYGREVLADAQGIWLLAHELAHQWWGNQVTCRDWNHFWLNEGMATFLSAAYREHRFGRSAYLNDIEAAKARYLKVNQAGKDRALVFPDWDAPSPEDRVLVYHKGAYVLHLLREELGEEPFWRGIRAYTRSYWGKSVATNEFQAAMEKASGRNLAGFFAKWVYP
jgi:aminopeptidase N